jgi:hypothetical protein
VLGRAAERALAAPGVRRAPYQPRGHDPLEWPPRNAGASLTPGRSVPTFGTPADRGLEYLCADAYAQLADQERLAWGLVPDDVM